MLTMDCAKSQMAAANIVGLIIRLCSWHMITAQHKWLRLNCGAKWGTNDQLRNTFEYIRRSCTTPFGDKSEMLELVSGCPSAVRQYNAVSILFC